MKYVLILLFTGIGYAQAQSIDDFKILVGTWKGTGFNSELTEVWAEPSSGTMMGMFKIERDNKIVLYEFMNIVKENGVFVLKVKHFNPEFQGWEEKDKHISFPLKEIRENKIIFEGLTINKTDDNELIFLLNVTSDDGSVRIEELKYTRVK